MKRIGGLCDVVADRDNLAAAAWRAAAGKRDYAEVAAFFRDLDGALATMHDQLTRGRSPFSSYTSFGVRDTKSRTIHMPAFRDRVKHGGEWNRCERGVPFLGFVVYPDRVRLGRQGRRRLRRKVRALERAWARDTVDERTLQARGTALFAHVSTANDSAWCRTVLSLGRVDCDEGEAQEPRRRGPGRLLEQHGQELPLRVSQQEDAWQPQQEPGLPGLSCSRHDDGEQWLVSPDDAPSCSSPARGLDEASGKPSTGVEILCRRMPERTKENTSAEAPRDGAADS